MKEPQLLSDFPGYKALFAKACRTEARLRGLAFFPVPPLLCGVPAVPFTPRHFLILDQAKSPWLGHPCTNALAQIGQFLWIVSPQFVVPSAQLPLARVHRARTAFISSIWPKLRRKKTDKVSAAIDAYIEHALFDRESGSDSTPDAPPVVHFAACLVDEFADAYGWPIEVFDRRGQPIPGAGILDIPFSRLFQIRRARRLRHDGEAVLINRLSDRVEREVILRYEEQKAARSAKRSKKAK